MDTSILKAVGQIAGIGGLCIGVFLILIRVVVAKMNLPELTKDQAAKVLRHLIWTIFAVAIAGIFAWLYIAARPGPVQDNGKIYINCSVSQIAILDGSTTDNQSYAQVSASNHVVKCKDADGMIHAYPVLVTPGLVITVPPDKIIIDAGATDAAALDAERVDAKTIDAATPVDARKHVDAAIVVDASPTHLGTWRWKGDTKKARYGGGNSCLYDVHFENVSFETTVTADTVSAQLAGDMVEETVGCNMGVIPRNTHQFRCDPDPLPGIRISCVGLANNQPMANALFVGDFRGNKLIGLLTISRADGLPEPFVWSIKQQVTLANQP